MRPLDIYDLSVWLSEQATTEAGKRAAVSRLYYGLHLEACCRYFRENPNALPLSRNRRHAALPDLFRSSLPQYEHIADGLAALSAMRAECDYRVAGPLQHERMIVTIDELLAEALSTAAALLADLDAYSPGESTGAEARVTGT